MGSIGSAIGVGSSLLGAKDAKSGAKSAARQSKRDAAALAAANEAKLKFEKEKYADWEATYGGLEDNLSDYYNSLTPDYFAAQGLEAFEKEQGIAVTRLRENLAQRGIEDSGISAAMEIDNANVTAVERARIRADAPIKAANEQLRFLQVGLAQNPGASLSQAHSDIVDSLGGTASASRGRAERASVTAGNAVGSAVNTVGSALDDYFST